jgi:2-polyprenyl-6-methoxyphenol hydroxylase-like FAD-dependent oxidoreductase
MGILSDLENVDLKIKELTFVDKNNKRKGGLNAFRIRKLMDNRFYNLLRSDLAKVLFNHLGKNTEIIFGDTIDKIEQNTEKTTITFHGGEVRSFDLVVGADGLHSNVRTLVFGEESQFEKYYGYYTVSFTIENNLSNENAFISYTIPGKQANIYSLKENRLTTLFIFSSPEKLSCAHRDIHGQMQILRQEFNNAGWECASLLSKLDTAPDFYFDSVSQIKMNHWSDGRITLVGDACSAPSLLAGQGSTLAMVAAYILAGELKVANGNYNAAFQQYETIFKPFIDKKQKVAQSFANSLVPKNAVGVWIRNTFTNFIFSSFLSKWLVRKYMTDNIKIKDY